MIRLNLTRELPASSSCRAMLPAVAGPYVLHSTLVIIALWLAGGFPQHLPAGFVNPNAAELPQPFDRLIRWDAHWYTYVAETGYDHRSIVFFPAIIFLLRFGAAFGASSALAGLVLCNIFAFLSFCAMYALFRLDHPERTARRALLVYAVMPTSFFLNSVYTEPLFLTFTFAGIYFARTGRWWLGGSFGAAAALTRNLGGALALALAYELWRQRRRQKMPASLLLAPALPVFAFLGFMAYNHYLLGNPLAFVTFQQTWGREFGWPTDNFMTNLRFMGILAPNTQSGVTLDTFLVLLGLGALVRATLPPAQIRVSYLAIGWLWLLVPLFSTTSFLPLYSLSRFLLVVFPVYLVLAELPGALFHCFAFVSALLLILCAILFANWFWVG